MKNYLLSFIAITTFGSIQAISQATIDWYKKKNPIKSEEIQSIANIINQQENSLNNAKSSEARQAIERSIRNYYEKLDKLAGSKVSAEEEWELVNY